MSNIKKAKRKTFTTTIDEDTQNKFKAKCAEKGMAMNDILELFMCEFINDKIRLEVTLIEDK